MEGAAGSLGGHHGGLPTRTDAALGSLNGVEVGSGSLVVSPEPSLTPSTQRPSHGSRITPWSGYPASALRPGNGKLLDRARPAMAMFLEEQLCRRHPVCFTKHQKLPRLGPLSMASPMLPASHPPLRKWR